MNNFEELNYQQQRFCDEYLVSFNAFRAALAAGYSENTARKAELLHNPKIQSYLKTGMEKARQRLEVTHDMILREFAKIAFSNMGNYYDERGAIKPMCCMTSEEKAAVSYYQIMDSIDEHGNRVGEFGKIKLHNKMSALDKIARHVGFYERKAESSKPKAFEEEQEAGSLKPEAFEEERKAESSKPKAFEEEQEAGSLKQEAFEEERKAESSKPKAFEEEQEAGSLKQEAFEEERKAESSKPKAFEEEPEAGGLKPKAFVAGVEEEVCLVVNGEGELAGETGLEKAASTTVGGDDSVLGQVAKAATKILTLSPQGRQIYSPVECDQGGGSVNSLCIV